MSYSQRSMTRHSSRFTDGEFQPNRQQKSTDNLLMEYLCVVRQQNEISAEQYKEYVEQQLELIREINVNWNFPRFRESHHIFISYQSNFHFLCVFFHRID